VEPLVVWTLAAAAVLVLLRRSRAPSAWLLALVVVASTAAGHALWAAHATAQARTDAAVRATLPEPVGDGGYVTSSACRACHPAQYDSWHRSYHRTMTQPATAATVRAPFAGETLRSDDGVTYRLGRDGDALFADVGGQRRRITMVTGSHHMQAFWLPGAGGNAQFELPFTWLLDEQRWVGRRDVFLVGSDYGKTPSMWNRICVECHVTGGQPGFDARVEVPRSRVAELGIACEACHGPGATHVAANASPFRRLARHGGDGADDTIVNPRRLDGKRASEVCGQCHGIGCPPDGWRQRGIGYRPGTPLGAVKPMIRLASLTANKCRGDIAADASFAPSRYWKDGMVRVSGREYSALLESPCHEKGALSCLSCHSMHDADPNWQLARAGDGSAACASCHAEIAGNVAAHSHHAATTCQDCHMPHTTYGLLRAMRSHRISVPSARETVETGRPNACNLCHLDRTLSWTAQAMQRWWGTPPPPLDDEQRTVAASLLGVARGEAGVRALWAWSIGWPAARKAARAQWTAPALIELLDDEYAAIRFIAYRSLRGISGFENLKYDYVGPREARWAAQAEARARAARLPAGPPCRELLMDGDGRFVRGELERLMAERPEDDEMFLAE
jgi:Doubled CXXCH motif (Paired_CXXCH_1)/Cytochrome c554 and c-prime